MADDGHAAVRLVGGDVALQLSNLHQLQQAEEWRRGGQGALGKNGAERQQWELGAEHQLCGTCSFMLAQAAHARGQCRRSGDTVRQQDWKAEQQKSWESSHNGSQRQYE